MAIQNVVLGSGFNTVFSSTGDNGVSVIYICNTSQNLINFNLYAVPNGAVPDVNNIVYYSVPVQATDTYVIDTEKFIMADGDALILTATADNVVTVTVSTMEL